jgi:hypothetical protein
MTAASFFIALFPLKILYSENVRFILNEAKRASMDFQLQRLQNVISDLASGLTPEDLARRRAGKWCAAEIMEHLYLSYTGSVRAFERCLSAGKPVASRPTLKQRAAIVVGLGYMPAGRKAPKFTVPRGHRAGQSAA